MKKIQVLLTGIIFALLILFLPFHFTVYAKESTVKTDVLNVRSGPGLSYNVIDQLQKNESFNVIDQSNDWLQIQYDNQTGWVASWLTSHGEEATQTAQEVMSQTDALNFRAGPSLDARILDRLQTGDRAIVLQRQGEWLQVQFNQKTGWINEKYTTIVSGQTQKEHAQKDQVALVNDQVFTVAVDALNVRKGADLSSKKIHTIYKNDQYQVLGQKGNWVQIMLKDHKKGWVYGFHGHLNHTSSTVSNTDEKNIATILANGTNIRQAPSTSAAVLSRANAGEQFSIVKSENDWYEVILKDGRSAFIANWVVSVNEGVGTKEHNTQRTPGTLNGLTIILDPGHGGNDKGTTGANGTFEKTITLKTAELLASKLKAAGATVHLTRETDRYISLQDRVWMRSKQQADAFISIHYDANPDKSINGFTTYYQYDHQKQLAQAVNQGLQSTLSIRNRGAQPANFYVLRQNTNNSILIELGFLSNPHEEAVITSQNFREQATYGIYKGILNYFN